MKRCPFWPKNESSCLPSDEAREIAEAYFRSTTLCLLARSSERRTPFDYIKGRGMFQLLP
jgi:hypothetical protein